MIKSIVRLSILGTLFLITSCADNADNISNSGRAAGAEQEVSAIFDQYSPALLKKDAATLDRIWAEELSFINPRGELLSKKDRMNNIKSGSTAFKALHETEKQIRMYGDTAVATVKVDVEGQYSGQEGTGVYRVTTVWARPKGAWQMVAVQMTRMTE